MSVLRAIPSCVFVWSLAVRDGWIVICDECGKA